MLKASQLSQILEGQLQQITDWHLREPVLEALGPFGADFIGELSRWAVTLNFHNYKLWHLEDLARDAGVSDAEIARIKRAIDPTNQKRNDAIERVDETLLRFLPQAQASSGFLHSETPGSMLDRLSINALKTFHMDEQVKRTDASAEHREKCAARLEILRQQRLDLSSCWLRLFEWIEAGQAHFKIYRQMKMYNDPTLNPVMYEKQGSLKK